MIVYIADWSLVLAPEECPFINADPDTIYDVLMHVCTKRSELRAIGIRSRAYVEKHYSVNALAARLEALYRDTAGISVPLQATFFAR